MNDLTTSGIGTVGGLTRTQGLRLGSAVQGLGGKPLAETGFAGALKQALGRVSEAQHEVNALAREFQLGNPKVSLEETVIAAQKASVTFQAAVQVRNRLVSVYSEIMNMNV